MFYVTLTGNLGADPETRYSSEGKGILSFRVAVNGRRRVDGEWADHTDWVRCTVMGGRVEFLGEHLTKGMRVVVRGRLEAGTYVDRNNETRLSLDVFADEVDFVSRRENSETSGDGTYDRTTRERTPATSSAPARGSAKREAAGGEDLEDLPFRLPRRIADDAGSVVLGGIL